MQVLSRLVRQWRGELRAIVCALCCAPMVEDKAGEAAIGDATVDGVMGWMRIITRLIWKIRDYHPILGCRGEGRRLDGCEFPLCFFPIKIV